MDRINVDFIVEFNGRDQKFKLTSDTDLDTAETLLRMFANADENDQLTVIDKDDNSIVDILHMIKPPAIDYLSSSSNKMKRYILIVNKKGTTPESPTNDINKASYLKPFSHKFKLKME